MDLSKFTKNGKFLMLALDHRESFKKLINPQNPESVTNEEAIALKKEIIDATKNQFSGVLIDQEYGLPAYLEKNKPFLLPVEKTGYNDQSGERITELEYGIAKIIGMGASGAKLLLYFNPRLKSAEKQLQTAREVVDECKNRDYPLFLEIVTYGIDHEPTLDEREKLIMDSLKLFLRKNIIPDVFKLEYPGSALACQTITAILGNIPWILLTRGVTFDEFVPQLKDATKGGAQGFLAGRALWQEACSLKDEEKEIFLKDILPERFRLISEIVKG